MQVYPSAALLDYVDLNIPVYFIDPKPALLSRTSTTIITEKASVGIPDLVTKLLEESF